MGNTKPTILSIVPFPFLPPKKGGDWCAYYTCHFLAKQWPMLVATTQAADYPANFRTIPLFADNKWKYLSYKYAKALLKLAKQEKAGAIFLHQPFMGPIALYVAKKLGIPLMVYVHNLEYQRFQSMGKPWWVLLYFWEKWIYQHADLLLFISDQELATAKHAWKIPPEKCLHIPYGVLAKQAPAYDPTSLKQQLGLQTDMPVFLFFGSMSYAPNVEAVLLLLNEIAPRWAKQGKKAQWIICGGGLPQALQAQISQTADMVYKGFVENLTPYIQAADLMLNPVLSGGGVKTKVMEALNWGTTVISTQSGALGIDRSNCQQKLLIAADHNWEDFTQLMAEALPHSQQTMPQAFYEQYAWERIMGKVSLPPT